MSRKHIDEQKKGSGGVGWATIILSWTILLLALGARLAFRTENTAQGVAILRFLSTFEDDAAVRGPDDWAQFFVPTAVKLAAPYPFVRQRLLKYINDTTPGAYEALVGRTRYFDSQLVALLSAHEDIQQLVVLGAGYDSRSLRFYRELAQRTHPVLRIEADLPDTQSAKQARVTSAAAALAHSAEPHPFANLAAESLHFAPTNFNTDNLLEALRAAAYDPNKRTVFLWEGVAAYLQPEAVNSTLDFVRRHSRAGSFLLFDFSPVPEPLIQLAQLDPEKLDRLRRERPSELAQYMAGCYGMAETFLKIAALGEPAGFGIPTDRVSAYLSEHGLRLLEHVPSEELQRRYLTRSDGSALGRIACYEHVVTAETLPLSA